MNTRLKIPVATGLLVVAILAAGCQQDEAATPTSTPAPTPTSAPIATATPTQTPTLVPTPTAVPIATATPTPTTAGREPHPTDPYFALDHVLDIAIEIPRADWDTLRNQTRTLEDVFAEIGANCLSQPFASIYSWFPARVTVDGETYADVGVRKKGFVGSQSPTKPALKLRFDKYVEGQTLGGVLERMTLNNGIQDPSLINTCLAYQVFADAGLPAPRCNFATVSVNSENLGLYVHVEDLKTSMVQRTFANAEGNLYEGTVSDFRPGWRGTFEKKTNEDAADWSDIDAVVAALQDPSEAGWEALKAAVDLDRFLSFWAAEVLVGHWDGYAGGRNNYHFYREPDGPFVFIPWGVDDVFHLRDDPNAFDEITEPPPSVLAHGAIAHRLYQDAEGRSAYTSRLRDLLDTVWNEAELLKSADAMAAIVQGHVLPEERAVAAADAERVRQFIKKRRAEILDDLTPEPPDWPWPLTPSPCAAGTGGFEPGAFELHFETTWGNVNPFEAGKATYLRLDGTEQAVAGWGIIAGVASPEEQDLLPDTADAASLSVFSFSPDGSIEGFTLVLSRSRLSGGATLVIGEDEVAGGRWSIPAGADAPDRFSLFTQGRLELDAAGSGPRAAITGRLYGAWGGVPLPADGEGDGNAAAGIGLVINELASKGEPLGLGRALQHLSVLHSPG